MKVALYIEDGFEQIVLTPETDTEKGIVNKLSDDTRSLSVYRGEFYHCRGGWVRHGEPQQSILYQMGSQTAPSSTIIVLRKKEPPV